MRKKTIIMVGPDINGLGGISRVAKILRDAGLFERLCITYIPSNTDTSVNKTIYLLRNYGAFLSRLLSDRPLVYIHTSSNNSFFRKSFFLFTALLFRLKTLVHIHPTHFYMFLSGLRGIKKQYVFFLLRKVHAFIVLSVEMRTNILSLSPTAKVFLLRNPVDMQSLANIRDIKRLSNRLLFLGWYIREKGVYELVDAAVLLKQKGIDFHLDFYGTKQVNELKAYVADKGLTNMISVNGWIGDEEKCDALYRSTMLILPSHSEGIPNVILEAMATRAPIVSTCVGGLREILRDNGNCVIIEVNNAKDLAEKIIRCLTDQPLCEKISDQAYREAREKYDIAVISEGFSSIMDKIVSY